MSDVRALLKAKRQEVRINHPLAAYTSTGQLRCVACVTAVKHATAWEGHIGSKLHRTNAARLREERAREAQREAKEQEETLKRKAMEVDNEDSEDREEEGVGASDMKKRKVDSKEPAPAGIAKPLVGRRAAIPVDFFSDPSMAPAPQEEDEEEADGAGAGTNVVKAPSAEQDVLDSEWKQFQQSVINAPDYQETYERATVVAEAVLSTEVPQGFPSAAGAAGEGEGAPEKEEELDEETLRRRKEQDERELIIDRLLEEEQAQEEADARVSLLKNKLEALRRKREATKAGKKAAKSS